MENKETIRKNMREFYEEVMNKGNIDVVDRLLDPNFKENEITPGFEPTRAGMKEWVKAYRAAFPDLRVEIKDILVDENKGIARARFTGTHRDNFMGISPTLKKIEIDIIDIVKFKDSKAVEHWGLTDTAKMMQQLEITPEQMEKLQTPETV